MCYDTAQLAYKIYKEAKRLKASPEEIEELRKKWKRLGDSPIDLYHTSGYSHQKLAAISSAKGVLDISRHHWGLIPHWVKDTEQAEQIWNNTINARGETIFDKPSFRDAANKHRCIIPLDGFYEHHHKAGKTYPFFVRRVDKQRMFVGGLLSDWVNKETGKIISTTSIVTTKGNELLSQIHNNPKSKEPRMPLIIDDENAMQWLEGSKEEAMELIRPNTEQELEAWTVRRIRGKDYMGNRKDVQDEFVYDELNESPELF